MVRTHSVGRAQVRIAGKTDVGQVRAHNEDHLVVGETMALGVVADGMGGHAAGDVASQLATETVAEYYGNTGKYAEPTFPFRFPTREIERNRMCTAIKLANSRIFETSQRDADKSGMGCTIEAIHFVGRSVFIGHVGDSRVYRLREGRLRQLTEDHSLLNDFRRMKEMSGEDVENFAHKNVVVRALGLAERVQVDVIEDTVADEDLYLLCSDGLSDMLDDNAIAELLSSGGVHDLEASAARLVDAANQAGGKDNITAMLAHVVVA